MVDMSSWESWQRDYRFGVILVMPPPHVAAPIDALRQAHDPKSHAICSAHISVSDPLRRELTDDAQGEIRELLRTVEPFEVQYDRPTASTRHPGVTCPVGPQERFDELRRTVISAIRRFTIPAYCAIFSALTVWAGQDPGFEVPDPSRPYPWDAVTLTWLKLAVLSLGLHVLLRPASYDRSIGRVWSAAVFFAIAAWAPRRSITDMPGYYYMVGMFAIVT